MLGYSGWQEYELGRKRPGEAGRKSVASFWALGILGMPGFTAYMGLLDIGQPKAGETLVVAAATGPVGATVGQIGKIKGCRVVGVAGGAEKCRHAVEVLGFDLCLDHHAADFAEQLKRACPNGIDIYYENVGGKVFDAVLPLLNTSARVPVCGFGERLQCDGPARGAGSPAAPDGDHPEETHSYAGLYHRPDYGHRIKEFREAMGRWVQEGKIHYREQITDGLENAPEALIGLLEGRNFGKVVIRVAVTINKRHYGGVSRHIYL